MLLAVVGFKLESLDDRDKNFNRLLGDSSAEALRCIAANEALFCLNASGGLDKKASMRPGVRVTFVGLVGTATRLARPSVSTWRARARSGSGRTSEPPNVTDVDFFKVFVGLVSFLTISVSVTIRHESAVILPFAFVFVGVCWICTSA